MRRLVILLLDPIEPQVEADMRRWWRGHCVKHFAPAFFDPHRPRHFDEVYFEVGQPVRYNVREGIKRLASFGIRARAALR